MATTDRGDRSGDPTDAAPPPPLPDPPPSARSGDPDDRPDAPPPTAHAVDPADVPGGAVDPDDPALHEPVDVPPPAAVPGVGPADVPGETVNPDDPALEEPADVPPPAAVPGVDPADVPDDVVDPDDPAVVPHGEPDDEVAAASPSGPPPLPLPDPLASARAADRDDLDPVPDVRPDAATPVATHAVDPGAVPGDAAPPAEPARTAQEARLVTDAAPPAEPAPTAQGARLVTDAAPPAEPAPTGRGAYPVTDGVPPPGEERLHNPSDRSAGGDATAGTREAKPGDDDAAATAMHEDGGIVADGDAGETRAGEHRGAVAVAPPERSPTDPLIGDADGFQSRWDGIQVAFVDEPRQSVERADGLVGDVIDEMMRVLAAERERLGDPWCDRADASTEDLRLALQRYRAVFRRLLAS